MRRLQARRERALARIGEPTITKQEFMRLIGLQETQATRYLQGGIVKAWKIPCRWTEIGRERWEWRVSKRDAERVKRRRQGGRLGLHRKKYRAMVDADAARIRVLRRAGRLGRSGRHYGRRHTLKAGCLTIAETAELAGVSPYTVSRHISTGELKAARIRVGGCRVFTSISPSAARAYAARTRPGWRPRASVGRVHRAGRITLREAQARYGVATGTLAAAARRGALATRKIGGLLAARIADVRRFAA